MGKTKEALEIIGSLIVILGIVWQISQAKAAIDKAIDAVKDEAITRYLVLEKRFEIHLENYILRQEVLNMLISQLNEKIDHKHSRTYSSLRNIEKYFYSNIIAKLSESVSILMMSLNLCS